MSTIENRLHVRFHDRRGTGYAKAGLAENAGYCARSSGDGSKLDDGERHCIFARLLLGKKKKPAAEIKPIRVQYGGQGTHPIFFTTIENRSKKAFNVTWEVTTATGKRGRYTTHPTEGAHGSLVLQFPEPVIEPEEGNWMVSVQLTDPKSEKVVAQATGLFQLKAAKPTDPTPTPTDKNGDPMSHVPYLSDDLREGRDTPSRGLDEACGYAAQIYKDYGLISTEIGDARNPYYQPFQVFGLSRIAAVADQPVDGGPFTEALSARNRNSDEKPDGRRGAHPFKNQHGFALPTAFDGPQFAHELSDTKRFIPALQGFAAESPHDLITTLGASSPAQNLVGVVPGTGPHRNQFLVISAHIDHIGKDNRGEDKIINGADDNASGSAVLLSLIPKLCALQQAGKLDCSIVFLLTSGEEKGLLGADYFVRHPVPLKIPATLGAISGAENPALPEQIELGNVLANINLDMLGRLGNSLSVIDKMSVRKSSFFHKFHTIPNAMITKDGKPAPFDAERHDIDEFYDRHDGWVFVERGIDTLFLFEGLIDGELNPDYHGKDDELEKIIADNNGDKLRRISDLALHYALIGANPDWRKQLDKAIDPVETYRRLIAVDAKR